jgi:peptidyl-prolyl cis-trans isomerase D
MAVLNKIRQRSLFLILIIALALFSFVLADLFKNSDALLGTAQDIVATVNGKNISRIDFMSKVENTQRQLGPGATSTQAMNRVYDQEVRLAVMNTQFEELGLSVEQDQMKDLIKQNFATYTEFQNEVGLFDENKLTEFVANLKAIYPDRSVLGNFQLNYDDWVNSENSIAIGAQERTYYNMVKAGVNATLNEAEVDYLLESSTRDVKYVQIPYSTINDSLVDVSKSDINAYINNNKSQFEVDASRDIVFVEFKEAPSLDDENNLKVALSDFISGKAIFQDGKNDTITAFRDIKVVDLENYVNYIASSDQKFNSAFIKKTGLPAVVADTLYNLNVGDVYGPYKDGVMMKLTKIVASKQMPDSAKVRHILIPFTGAERVAPDVTKTDVQAKATADSILDAIKNRRTKFVDLLSLSSDQVSNAKGGVIEFTYSQSYAPEFKEFSFSQSKGDVDVVKTSFGYHIIEVLNQSNFGKVVQVATIARKIEPSTETIDTVFTEASKFELAVQDAYFQDIAKENKYAVKPVNGIKILDEQIPGLGSQRGIVKWAFEGETKVGDFKRFTIPGGGYVVAQVTKVSTEGLMDTETASASVLGDIRKEKKAKMIRAKVTGSTVDEVSKNQSRPTTNSAAVNMKNPTITGAGLEPMVVGVAFGLKDGETSGLIDGERGVYMVTVSNIQEAAKLDNFQAMANRLSTTRSSAAQAKVYNALKETADIEDNRASFY